MNSIFSLLVYKNLHQFLWDQKRLTSLVSGSPYKFRRSTYSSETVYNPETKFLHFNFKRAVYKCHKHNMPVHISPLTLFLYISPITSIKPHPIPSDFICACVCLLCYALPAVWVWFGWEWALAAEWKRRQKRSRAKTLFQLRPGLLQPLPSSTLLLHISWLCPESPAVVFSYRLISCTALFNVCEGRMQILSSRRQRWGETAMTFLKMACGLHTAAVLLFLYRIRVWWAGNPGHLLNSVWPVADVSKSCSKIT